MSVKLLKYEDFIVEEINIDLDSIVGDVKDYLQKISNDLNKVSKYFDQVIKSISSLPRKLKISILVLIIPIFSYYLSETTIFNKISLEDRLTIEIQPAHKLSTKKLTLSSGGWNFIKNHEQLKTTAYKLGDGKITIGWGHAEDIKKSKYQVGDRITKSEAQELIKNDMKIAADGIRRIIKEWQERGVNIQLTQNQFDVLVSLAFNTGVQSVRESDFIQEIKKGNFKKASELIKRFKIDDNYPGLAKRRKLEAELFIK